MADYNIENEFPEFKDKLAGLKENDKSFAHSYTQFDQVNREILKIEKDVNLYKDEDIEKLKKQRLALKDQLLAALEKAA